MRALGRASAPLLVLITALACGGPAEPQARASAQRETTEPLDRPVEVAREGYVSSRSCRACHPGEYQSWHASYHRTMTQVVTPDAVVGPYEDVTLEREGRRWRLLRRGEEIWAEQTGGPGSPRRVRLALATGSHHFQAYWIPSGAGRELQLFEWCYDRSAGRWMPMDALPLAPEAVRQTGPGGGRWNRTCNRCHATGAEPRLAGHGGLDRDDTRVAEFGIACEACHGPGEAHVRLNRDPGRRYELHLDERPDPSIVNPAELPRRLQAQVCGQCHSVFDFPDRAAREQWARAGFEYRPGDDLHATRRLIEYEGASPIYRRTKFWPDGEVRVNGREYNSLLRTPCFQRGSLTCLSCHSMHPGGDDPRSLEAWRDDQLRPGMRGNAACTGCHAELAAPAPLAAHTRHAPDSPGSACQDCHMPHTAWGLHKATRSHEVTSPDVAATLASGRPNACSLCHLDRPLAWVASALEQRHGIPAPELSRTQREVSAAVVWTLAGDAGQRALLAWHLGWQPALETSGADWVPPYLAELLTDPYPAVRGAALRALRRHPGFEEFDGDLAAPPAEREAARRRVLARWREAAPAQVRPEVLLAPGGRLRAGVVQQLRRQRDLRPVYLAE